MPKPKREKLSGRTQNEARNLYISTRAEKKQKKVRDEEVFNRKCFAKLKAKMNFDDIVWLPLFFFCICVFHPFSFFFVRFFSASFFQCLTNFFFYSFSKYFSCKFFAYIFAIFQRMKASNTSVWCYTNVLYNFVSSSVPSVPVERERERKEE